MKQFLICLFIMFACIFSAFGAESPPVTEKDTPDMIPENDEQTPPSAEPGFSMQDMFQQREAVSEKAVLLLDSMVGNYRGNTVIDGVQHTVDLTIEPKILNNYYKGYYTLKTDSGDLVSDVFMVLSFNSGGMTYLFFNFDHDGYVRNYVGSCTDDYILVHSSFPGVMGFTRWTVVDETGLKKEDWLPKPEITNRPQGEPDRVIQFKRLP